MAINGSWINQAAAHVTRAYSPWISYNDVRQQLWVWAYENRSRVDDYLALPDGERIVRSVLNKEARNYAVRERAAMSGNSPEDVIWYTPSGIKKILPDVFDYEDWQSFEMRGEISSGKPASWSGDRLAMIIDVKGALDRLADDRVELLREHYGRGVSAEACAYALGIEVEACRKRVQRAVQAVSEALNNPRGVNPYEGATYEDWKANQRLYDTRSRGRKAMSNAAARSMTDID